jgi:pimeloyl-ACP methyl ester carboxylesterase
MINTYTNYFKTEDAEQIFFTTNFKVTDKKVEDVLVFNYGLVCSNYHWSKQLDYFDKQGYKILIHDYRGHYHSTGEHKLENITFDQITNDIYNLFNHLNINSSIMLGHSMGVNICLEFAKKFPDKVKKLILISGTTVPVYNIMFNSNIVDQIQPYILKVLDKYPDTFKTIWKFSGWNPIARKIIHMGGFNMDQVSDEFIEIYLNKVGELGPHLFFQLIEQMNSHHILASIESISTKSLIIGGDKDNVIPNYLQRILSSTLKNSELYIIRNGSHVPQVDFPDFVNERIDSFLESSS